jgi:hypothetical protein
MLPALWAGMKDTSADGRKKPMPDAETILSQAQHKIQHDKIIWFWSCCHPEPCPELDSGLVRDLGFEFSVLAPCRASPVLTG